MAALLCVYCGAPVEELYRSYGESVSLCRCSACRCEADPYVERDWTMVALDVALLKTPVLRHVLRNETVTRERVMRLVAWLVLLDTFVRGRNVDAPLDLFAMGESLASGLAMPVSVAPSGTRSCARLLAECAALWLVLGRSTPVPMAVLVGRAFPVAAHALTLVWDFSHLHSSWALFEVLAVASVSVALHAATARTLLLTTPLTALVLIASSWL